MKTQRLVLWFSGLALLSLSIVSCNDSGWTTSESSNDGFGWADVASYSVNYTDHGTGYADLSGTAFVSSSYVRHRCVGWSCFETRYDDSYPGVDVSWENTTNSKTGAAASRYGNMTDWSHRWTASVPLEPGENEIIIRAADPAGNVGTATIVLEFLPPPPSRVGADTGDGQINLIWDDVIGVQNYNVYWSTISGFETSDASVIYSTVSPYLHQELTNGEIYYYRVTSNSSVGESWASSEAAGVAGAANRPANVTTDASWGQVVLRWDNVPGAFRHNIYWSNDPHVTRSSRNQISDALSPYTHSNLLGLPYYYAVTAENIYGESLESEIVMAQIPARPPAPSWITAELDFFSGEVTVSWNPVPGADYYTIYRCSTTSNSCFPLVYRRPYYATWIPERLLEGDVYLGRTYGYSVSAHNEYGHGERTRTVYVTPDCYRCIH